ncbi:MAG: dynamin family protein [Desulfomonile tiedjei]|uniref:Dynamin family protein n=1 Tax=Desulfomonile tiedjei TaxID=2358 RepID=A0A9D6Z8M1_9BACT|nr:dynamin family protein [Desulfomonile tiedjei]
MRLPGNLNNEFEFIQDLKGGKLLRCILVRSKSDGKESVIKLLPSEYAGDKGMEERFRTFFLNYNQIPSSGIARGTGLKKEGEAFYSIEDYCPGTSLISKNIEELGRERFIEILSEVCDVLNFAHNKGVFHLCITPRDILVDDSASVMVVGFGAAVSAKTGRLNELPADYRQFLAPEILQGAEPSRAADIYSLAATILKIFPSLRRNDVLQRCLSQDPHQRMDKILSLQQHLKSIVASGDHWPPEPDYGSDIEETNKRKLTIRIDPSDAMVKLSRIGDLDFHQVAPGWCEISGTMEQWQEGVVVTIEKNGFDPRTLELCGLPERSELQVKLRPPSQHITIKTAPPGAEIRVEATDEILGTANEPWGLKVCWEPGMQLLIQKDGFEPYRYQFSSGQPLPSTVLRITLSAVKPTIRLIDNIVSEMHKVKAILGSDDLKQLALPPDDAEMDDMIGEFQDLRFHSSQRYTVMVLGEYSVGKSTLLNLLLDLPPDRRLPTFDKPTTAKPIRLTLRGENDPEASWVMDDNAEIQKTWDEAISQATTGTNGQRNDIKEIKVYLDHPLLIQSDIMDMPGTGAGWFKDHQEITREYLRKSEMALIVVGRMEPGDDAAKNFSLVQRWAVSHTVVFNAWGSLDERKDRKIRIDQGQLETTVKELFPWAFLVDSGTRVYALKCIEAQDKGISLTQEWGLEDFKQHFCENCVGDFLTKAGERRKDILRIMVERARGSSETLEDCLSEWEERLSKVGNEGREIQVQLKALSAVERRVRNNVGEIAEGRAKEILDTVFGQVELFINENVRWGFDLARHAMKGIFDCHERQALEKQFTDSLINKYLRIKEENNWLQLALDEFVHECLPILEREWGRFTEEQALDISMTQTTGKGFDLPFEAIGKAAVEGVQAMMAKLLGAGAVLGILLLIPGKIVLDIIIALVILLKGGDPLERARQSAIKKFRMELDFQEIGFKQEMVDLIMTGPNARIRSECERRSLNLADEKNEDIATIKRGMACIEGLQQSLAEIGQADS